MLLRSFHVLQLSSLVHCRRRADGILLIHKEELLDARPDRDSQGPTTLRSPHQELRDRRETEGPPPVLGVAASRALEFECGPRDIRNHLRVCTRKE
jgi:hypothetical protein